MSKTSQNNRWHHWRRTALLMTIAVGVVVYAAPRADQSILMMVAALPLIDRFGRDDDQDD